MAEGIDELQEQVKDIANSLNILAEEAVVKIGDNSVLDHCKVERFDNEKWKIKMK